MLGPVLECAEIDGEPLRLVPTQQRHLAACVRWLNDPVVTRFLAVSFGLNDSGEEKWYAEISADPAKVVWSIELGDLHVGQTAIENIRPRERTGVTGLLIGEPSCWGKGIATAVMRRRAAYAFRELNLVALYTEIFTTNEASLRAAARAGYREWGRRPFAKYQDGEYLTSWLGVLSREEWERAAVAPSR